MVPFEGLLVGEHGLFPAPGMSADAAGSAEAVDAQVAAVAALAVRRSGEPEDQRPVRDARAVGLGPAGDRGRIVAADADGADFDVLAIAAGQLHNLTDKGFVHERDAAAAEHAVAAVARHIQGRQAIGGLGVECPPAHEVRISNQFNHRRCGEGPDRAGDLDPGGIDFVQRQ